MVEFNNVDGETSNLALTTNFVDDIKQTYRQEYMAQKIFKDFSE